MMTVLDNAYYKKAQEHPNFTETHQKILLVLMHEKKHYTKDELLCLANYSQEKLEDTLSDLEETGLVQTSGCLTSLAETETLTKQLIPELALVKTPPAPKKKNMK